MIQALFDEAIELSELKESLATRVDVPVSNVDSNRIYGSFPQGNATMVYLDDDSNHLKLAWDADFIRVARDWAINSFNIDVMDENFYVNIRAIILLIQVVGGIGFFFLIIEPFSKLIIQSKEERERELKLEIFKIDTPEISIKNLSIRTIIFSFTCYSRFYNFHADSINSSFSYSWICCCVIIWSNFWNYNITLEDRKTRKGAIYRNAKECIQGKN